MIINAVMPNHLNAERSSYLKQHANQAVEWMTWSQAALEKAQLEQKPILISIGYSACHWCQTMSRENFEDSYIASLMNRHFICILVDREERPDLDQVYMEAVRMFDQSAGWPLHVFCLPSGEPFWGGTFFPKEDTGQGIAPWPQVLIRISEHYRNHRDELVENSGNVIKNLIHANHTDSTSLDSWSPQFLIEATHKLCALHDDEFGGFTQSPKFPPSMKIDFLLAISESQYARKNKKFSTKVMSCVKRTLDSMAKGGIFDHIEGGFFRYSIDSNWSFPHFEKMLLENSLLVSTYSRAYRKFKNPLYRKVVQKSIHWILTEMGDETTGFASSVYSESEEQEGKYYLWSQEELNEILGNLEAGRMMEQLEPINGAGKPLYLPRLNQDEQWNEFMEKNVLSQLQAFRSKRHAPTIDHKRVASLNALVIKALIDSAIALQEKSLLEKACTMADWMKKTYYNQDLIHSILYPQGADDFKKTEPVLDDFAYWAESLLQLACYSEIVRVQSSKQFVEDAESIVEQCSRFFSDEQKAGYFFSASNSKSPPPVRKKFWYDHSSPSGNSSLLRVFSLLHQHTKKEKWKIEYLQARAGYSNIVKKDPEGMAHALTSISETTIGIPTLFVSESALPEAFQKLGDTPHRPILLDLSENEDAFILELGDTRYEMNSISEAFETLFG